MVMDVGEVIYIHTHTYIHTYIHTQKWSRKVHMVMDVGEVMQALWDFVDTRKHLSAER